MPPRKAPDSPALDIELPSLHPGRRRDVGVDDDVDALEFTGSELLDLQADGARLLECRLTGCALGDARLRRGRLSSCVFDGVTATTLDLADSTWADVVIRGGRLGALLAHGAELRRVAVVGARIDYVNLRAATLAQVRLVDCRIGELDLGGATAADLAFAGSRVDRLLVTNARLTAVSLVGLEFAAVEGGGHLRGAIVDQGQLSLLAPALAAQLGIDVQGAG